MVATGEQILPGNETKALLQHESSVSHPKLDLDHDTLQELNKANKSSSLDESLEIIKPDIQHDQGNSLFCVQSFDRNILQAGGKQSNEQASGCENNLSSIKLLQRQASPEMELDFKFGAAPKIKESNFNFKFMGAEKIVVPKITLNGNYNSEGRKPRIKKSFLDLLKSKNVSENNRTKSRKIGTDDSSSSIKSSNILRALEADLLLVSNSTEESSKNPNKISDDDSRHLEQSINSVSQLSKINSMYAEKSSTQIVKNLENQDQRNNFSEKKVQNLANISSQTPLWTSKHHRTENNSLSSSLSSEVLESRTSDRKLLENSPKKNLMYDQRTLQIAKSCHIFVDIAKECELKSAKIQAQKYQINELENFGKIWSERNKKLEIETFELKHKIQQYVSIHQSCKNQVTELKISHESIKQQWKSYLINLEPTQITFRLLKCEIAKIKDYLRTESENFTKFRENLKTVTKDIGEANEKLAKENEIYSAKIQCLQLENRKSIDHVTELDFTNKRLEFKARKLEIQNSVLEIHKTNASQQLRKQNLELQELLFEKKALEEQIRSTVIFQKYEITSMSDSLNREKIRTSNLEKDLERYRTYQLEVLNSIQEMPAVILSGLMGEDSLLSKMIDQENKSQEKINQAISSLEIIARDTPISMKMTMENISAKFECMLSGSESNSSKIRESIIELIKDANQSFVDQGTQNHLNNAVSSLSKFNEDLLNQNKALYDEKMHVASEFHKSISIFSTFEENLKNKIDEFNEAIASQKEVSLLKSQIAEIENKNIDLNDKLKSKNEEFLNLKNDLISENESKEQKIQELEVTIRHNEIKLKNFDDEKIKLLAEKDEKNKIVCRELTENANSSKEIVKLKQEFDVESLQQKIKNKDFDLGSRLGEDSNCRKNYVEAEQKILGLQDELHLKNETSKKLELEVASYKEYYSKQAAQIQALKEHSLGIELRSNLKIELLSALSEISELRDIFQSVRMDNAQLIEESSNNQKTIEKCLQDYETQSKELGTKDLRQKFLSSNLYLSKENPALTEVLGYHKPKEDMYSQSKENSHIIGLVTETDEGSIDKKVQESTMEFEFKPDDDLFSEKLITQQKNTEFISQVSKKLKANTNLMMSTSNYSQCCTNDFPQLLDESEVENNTSIGKEHPVHSNIISDSFSLGDIDTAIESAPFSLSQDNEITAMLINIAGDPAPIQRSEGEKTRCGSKRIKNPLTYKQVTADFSPSTNVGYDELDEPSSKKQKSGSRIVASSTRKVKKQSDLSRPKRSSLRCKIEQINHPKLCLENQKINSKCDNQSYTQSIKSENCKSVPAESNVKQRRQDPIFLKETTVAKFGAERNTRGRNKSKLDITYPQPKENRALK
ncbi:BgTH12-05005 [Blumeria graminis f. sp. triticale]|uniref:BgTH12-05005 n=1 Tax=Blumeria graminis f. sp. triticale TaxID=1689686 RepID=A0A9W4D155_BLUGR|nr:BgTH12-05005 [Blumeria graminis f. sp. triticale]